MIFSIWETKIDKYNHILELVRTLLALAMLVMQIVILTKLFKGG